MVMLDYVSTFFIDFQLGKSCQEVTKFWKRSKDGKIYVMTAYIVGDYKWEKIIKCLVGIFPQFLQ